MIGFVQRLLGMGLVGEVLENILAIFHGRGANGKSVWLETVCGMLGPDYAMSTGHHCSWSTAVAGILPSGLICSA